VHHHQVCSKVAAKYKIFIILCVYQWQQNIKSTNLQEVHHHQVFSKVAAKYKIFII
jgi:hypothetical protein